MQSDHRINDKDESSNALRTEPVRPVMLIAFGSTQPAALCAIATQLRQTQSSVPVAFLFFDTMRREAVRDRCLAQGIPTEVFDSVCTPATFFRFEPPFGPSFDFDAELNSMWKPFVHDEDLEKVCRSLDTNGAAGTPAAGACFVLGSWSRAIKFIRRHLQALTAVADDKLNLEGGTLVLIHTSLRGGTGTGGYSAFGALVRQAVGSRAEIRTRVLMPTIFGGDEQSNANAYAAMQASYDAHSRDRGVPMLDTTERCHAPYTGESWFFGTNGQNAIMPRDTIPLQVMITLPYVLPEIQRVVDGFRIDNVPSSVFTQSGRPMRTVIETAVSIEACPKWIPARIAVGYLYLGLAVAQEQAAKAVALNIESLDAKQREELLTRGQKLIVDAKLDNSNLARRIAGDATYALTTAFQKAHQELAEVDNDTLGELVPKTTRNMAKRLAEIVTGCEKRSDVLATDLVNEVTALLPAPGPQALLLTKVLVDHFNAVAMQATNEAKKWEEQVKVTNGELHNRMRDFNDALKADWIYRRWNIVRDAAKDVLDAAQNAALARLRERTLRLLSDCLKTDGATVTATGVTEVHAGLIDALSDWHKRRTARLLAVLAKKVAELDAIKASLDLAINTRSSFFQRFVVGDDANVADLTRQAELLFRRDARLPALVDLISDKSTAAQAIEALAPTMPYFDAVNTDLQELVSRDQRAQDLVVHLIRNAKPFAQVDDTVEKQQGLNQRRDTLRLLVLPGGPSGPIARILEDGGLIDPGTTRVVAAADNRILYYYLREALPLYVLKDELDELRRSFRDHLSVPGARSPFWHKEGPTLAHIQAPSDNLRVSTGKLLVRALAVAPELVLQSRTGCKLVHQEEKRPGFFVAKVEEFDTFEEMRSWVERRPRILSDIDGAVEANWKSDPDTHEDALVNAYRAATGEQQDLLLQSLYDLKIDPAQRRPQSAACPAPPAVNSTPAARTHAGGTPASGKVSQPAVDSPPAACATIP